MMTSKAFPGKFWQSRPPLITLKRSPSLFLPKANYLKRSKKRLRKKVWKMSSRLVELRQESCS